MKNISIIIIVSIVLFIILLISSTVNANPDEEWRKNFADKWQDQLFNEVQQTNDGFIVGASTRSYDSSNQNYGNFDMTLIKTDSNGNQQWSKTYGVFENDILTTVLQTKDGYLLLGKTYGNTGYDISLIKTDKGGYEQWSKTFGGIETDAPYLIQQTTDNGYIILGDVYSGSYLIKINAEGNQQWKTMIKNSAQYLQQTSDGGYVIVGYLDEKDSNNIWKTYAWIAKTDENGKEQWNKTLIEGSVGIFVSQASDGGYIIAGNGISQKTNTYDNSVSIENTWIWLVKTDSEGNQQWNKIFGKRSEWNEINDFKKNIR